MADGLVVRRPLQSPLGRARPERQRLLGQPCLREMPRDQLRLQLRNLPMVREQDLANPAMMLPAGALEQGLIGHVLDQRVAEHVGPAPGPPRYPQLGPPKVRHRPPPARPPPPGTLCPAPRNNI